MLTERYPSLTGNNVYLLRGLNKKVYRRQNNLGIEILSATDVSLTEVSEVVSLGGGRRFTPDRPVPEDSPPGTDQDPRS